MESSNMNKNVYQHGKIYKIVDVGYNEQYFGSTTVELSTRMARHRARYREYNKTQKSFYSSFILFDKYGIENCKIELVESYPCDSKDELSSIKGRAVDYECANKCSRMKHGKTQIEERIQTSEFGKKAQRSRDYRENHRAELIEHDRKYYADNKEEY
jgi:hypothetical protein